MTVHSIFTRRYQLVYAIFSYTLNRLFSSSLKLRNFFLVLVVAQIAWFNFQFYSLIYWLMRNCELNKRQILAKTSGCAKNLNVLFTHLLYCYAIHLFTSFWGRQYLFLFYLFYILILKNRNYSSFSWKIIVLKRRNMQKTSF